MADQEPTGKTRVAVVGVGTFGKQHARVLNNLPGAELIAVVDTAEDQARSVAQEYGCQSFTDHRELEGKVDAAVIAVPTLHHAAVGAGLLRAGIDLLVEKPIAPDLASADALIAAARENNRILQIGHLERFNPIVEEVKGVATLPLFFEIHRMSIFSPRCLDVDVVLDLMIHDLDIVLDLVDSPLERFEATGIPVLSQKADIASVRLIFENGCVANLTASRVSTEKIRKLRFFQPRQYISIDYTRQDGYVSGVDAAFQLSYRPLKAVKGEPLARQAEAFLRAAATRQRPRVSGEDGRATLAVGLRIIEEMERHTRVVAKTLAPPKT